MPLPFPFPPTALGIALLASLAGLEGRSPPFPLFFPFTGRGKFLSSSSYGGPILSSGTGKCVHFLFFLGMRAPPPFFFFLRRSQRLDFFFKERRDCFPLYSSLLFFFPRRVNSSLLVSELVYVFPSSSNVKSTPIFLLRREKINGTFPPFLPVIFTSQSCSLKRTRGDNKKTLFCLPLLFPPFSL